MSHNQHTAYGYTIEGHPYELLCYFAEGASENALPEEIIVFYKANDRPEGDHLRIFKADDGLYHLDSSDDSPAENPADLLPWVIAKGYTEQIVTG
ncbi:MAG: hypothetical protein KDJ22_00325 [Candidatus Competibacteraceae bacterium]|nr:hypothetical protein [Candidatus Competibacteraceae bacterium]